MSQKMTLSRALRYKKRVVEVIRSCEMDVQTNNSRAKGEERDVDVGQALARRSALVTHLVEVKMALLKATLPIQARIFALAELKAEISFLQRIDVTHGMVRSRYRDEQSVEMEAVVRKAQRDARIKALQDQIDQYQTEIDVFNNETTIEISDQP